MIHKKIIQISMAAIFFTIMVATIAHGQDVITNKQEKAINKLIEDYIMDHPDIILKSIEEMRQREQRKEQEAIKENLIALEDEIMRNSTDPVVGNMDGDVTIVEFFDYRCGYCKNFYDTLFEVLNEDDNLRIVFKELPILGPSSLLAAKVAIAASRQNLYMPFHQKMMNLRGNFDEKRIFDIAEEVGLDLVRLKKDMSLGEVEGILTDTQTLANKLSIAGTPAIILGSAIVRGAIGKEELKAMIAAARK